MTVFKLLPAVAATALLSACLSAGPKETAADGPKPVYGTISADRGGGNDKLVATGAGTLVGAFLSKDKEGLAASDLPKRDAAARGAYRAPIGEKISWSNPESGNSGSFISTRDGWNSAGQYCREYRQEIVLRDRTVLSYGTACKQADGAWAVVTPSPA